MSKRFETTYPNLAKAIKENKVMSITNDSGEGIYIYYDASGADQEIGRVGYESVLDNYLRQNPDFFKVAA